MAAEFVAGGVVVTDMSLIKNKLALAAVTLVSAGTALADDEWTTDVSYLSYNEAQDRVSVSKALWDITRDDEETKTSINLVYDTMSGASPTGAIQGSAGSVTYTGASGGAGFSAIPQHNSASSTFSDTRVQIGASQERELNRSNTVNYGAVYSTEQDYESVGMSIGLERESRTKNTVFSMGFATTFDTISTSYAQGTPAPLTNTNNGRLFSEGERGTNDLSLGVTQVINPLTLAQFNISFSQSEGYHTDPYKVISVADDSDRILETFTESRPSSRQRNSVSARIIRQIANTRHSVHLGYRLYQDDWGIRSNTLDARFHYQLSARTYLEPTVRFYQQSAADFYQRKLGVDSNLRVVLPETGFVSADYRLDEMDSLTVGAKYGIVFSDHTSLRFRAAYLQQGFSTAEFESNTALLIQTSFSYQF